jgi:hypothetical protein
MTPHALARVNCCLGQSTPPRLVTTVGCHKLVPLGVVLVVLYRLGVVLVGVIYW